MAHALVVDDSRTIRRILSETLKELGYDVSEAENGRVALDALHAVNTRVQFILTDWNMPEMNGLEFLKHVREEKRFDRIPVIMVTSETEAGQMVEALEAGANEYIMKPFTPDILTDKLRIAGVLA